MNVDKLTSMPVLIIDAHNLFIRGFVASPRMSSHGDAIGGITTFLQSLSNMIHQFTPSHVHIIWEGGSGSPWRRSIYPEYKNGRRPRRLNRIDEFDPEDADEYKQIANLIRNYLAFLPVKQYAVFGCEADDMIMYLCKVLPREKNKIIVSTDKDFYQLINDKVKIFNPIKKVLIDPEKVKEEFAASCKNVVLSRAFLGDKSDNVTGIKGVGVKFIENNFPFLKEDKEYSLVDILEHIEKMEEKSKTKNHKKIIEEFDILRRNWKLMNLDSVHLTSSHIMSLEKVLKNETDAMYPFERIKLMKNSIKDGFTFDSLGNRFLDRFSSLMIRAKKEKYYLDETVYVEEKEDAREEE
jgi:DNA polymerase-1